MADFASMQSPGDQKLVFKGDSGTECEAFIREIRSRAFAKGKQRDNAWMADYASICFDGPALRWFEELEPEIQEDWALLRKALLLRYPAQEQSEGSAPSPLIPTPAAAPPRRPSPMAPQNSWRDLATSRSQSQGSVSSSSIATPAAAPLVSAVEKLSELEPGFSALSFSSNYQVSHARVPPSAMDDTPSEVPSHAFSVLPSEDDEMLPAPPPPALTSVSSSTEVPIPCTGRIKVILTDDSKNKVRYIRRTMNWSDFFKYTSKVSEALLVRYIPSSEPHAFEMLNPASAYEYLGIAWDVLRDRKLVLGPGSHIEAQLVAVKGIEPGPVNTPSRCKGEIRCKIWNVLPDQTVTATWIHQNGASYPLEMACMDDWLYVVADQKACNASHLSRYDKVHFLFDPI